MPSKTVNVGSAVGLHARPAARLVEAVRRHEARRCRGLGWLERHGEPSSRGSGTGTAVARWCVPPERAGLVPVPAVSELPCRPARLLGPACGGDRLVLLLLVAVCPRVRTLPIALQVCCRVSAAMRLMAAWEARAATTACESEDAARAQTKSDNVVAPPGDEQAIPAWMRVQQEPQRKAQ